MTRATIASPIRSLELAGRMQALERSEQLARAGHVEARAVVAYEELHGAVRARCAEEDLRRGRFCVNFHALPMRFSIAMRRRRGSARGEARLDRKRHQSVGLLLADGVCYLRHERADVDLPALQLGSADA